MIRGIVFFCLIWANAATAWGDPPTRVVAAIPGSFPPQYSLDKKGQPRGFAIDTMNAIARLANLDVHYLVCSNWNDAHRAIKNGKADLIPNMGITERRKEYVVFTNPIETFPVRIFVRSDNFTIRNAKDLSGHKVAVVKINIGYTLLQDRPDIELVVTDHWQDAVIKLLSGQVDALVYPGPVIETHLREARLEQRIKSIGKPLYEVKRGIAVDRDQPGLFERLQAAVNEFVDTPEYRPIYTQWYGRPKPFLTPMRMLWILGVFIFSIMLGVGIWLYVAQRKNAHLLEERVRQQTDIIINNEAKYRSLFDNMYEGFLRADLKGRIVMANQAATDMFGYGSTDELLQMHMKDLYAKPEQRLAFLGILQREGRLHNLEFNFKRKDGSEGWGLCNIRWYTDENGERAGTDGLLRDISERKESELKQAESREILQSVLDGINAAVFFIDPEQHQVLEVSAAGERLLGLSRSEIINQSCNSLICHAESPCKDGNCPYLDKKTILDETTVRHVDGHTVPVLSNIIPATINGQVQLVVFMFDISRMKDMERQLALAQKLESVGQLAAGIAHEINTPIQYIGSNLTFLEELEPDLAPLLNGFHNLLEKVEKGEDASEIAAALRQQETALDLAELTDEIRNAIEDSLQGVRQISNIVLAMKRFSHPSIGEKNLLNLNEAVQTVITMTRNEWKYVAEMHTELEADLPHVRCFVGDINQVLLNLTVNAAHAIDQQNNGSRKKGRIDIGTRSTPEHVEVFIRDTGCGIPEQHRGRIYDPFFTTKEVGKGTGQGLAISYAIMEKHNGSIDYTSKEGVGTVFTIRLPRN